MEECDPRTGTALLLADLAEALPLPSPETVAVLDDAAEPLGEIFECPLELRQGPYEVVDVLLVLDRLEALEGVGEARDGETEDLLDLLLLPPEPRGDLPLGGLAAELAGQDFVGPTDLRDLLDHAHREPDAPVLEAWLMACQIHHVAYAENLKPRSGSNFSSALMRPVNPSWRRFRGEATLPGSVRR